MGTVIHRTVPVMFKFLLRLVDSISPATKEEITPPVQAPSNINRNTDGSFMNERHPR